MWQLQFAGLACLAMMILGLLIGGALMFWNAMINGEVRDVFKDGI